MQNTSYEGIVAGGGGLYKDRPGFTLAETLITIGIIGIVAAMTLPAIIGRYQEKITVNQLKQTYSLLSQAFALAIEENGTVDTWCDIPSTSDYTTCQHNINNIISKYVKKIKECDGVNTFYKKACFAKEYANRFNDTKWSVPHNRPSFVMINGTSASFDSQNGDKYHNRWCNQKVSSSPTGAYNNSCGTIYVDINSIRNPNVDGKDLFSFTIYQDGIVPTGRAVDTVWVKSFESQCLGKRYYGPGGCTAWVIFNENMDYLHCDDLSWNGKIKCSK